MKSLVHFLASSATFLSTPMVVAYSGMSLSVTPGTGSLSDTYRLTVECRTTAACPRAEALSGMTNFSIVSESSVSNVVLQNGTTSVLEKNSYQIVPKRPGTFVFSISGSTSTGSNARVHVMSWAAKDTQVSQPTLLPPKVQRDSTEQFDIVDGSRNVGDWAGSDGNNASSVGEMLKNAFTALWGEYPKTRNAVLFLAILFLAYAFLFRRPTKTVMSERAEKITSTRNIEPTFPDENSSAEDCLALVRQNLETRYNMDVAYKSFDELVKLESDAEAAEMLCQLFSECGRHAYSGKQADVTAIRILTIEYLKHVA